MLKPTPLLVGLIVGLLGVVIFQARHIRELSTRKPASPIPSHPASGSVSGDAPERERLAGELDAARQEILQLRRATEIKTPPADGIAGRVAALKEALQRLPEQRIPQLVYATEADWYAAVDGPLETAEDFRKAMARLRGFAEVRFAKVLKPALKDYMNANGGRFPPEVPLLQPFFAEGVDPAALQHLHVVRADSIKTVRMGGEWAITQVTLVDSEFDAHIVIGPNGFGSYGGPKK